MKLGIRCGSAEEGRENKRKTKKFAVKCYTY
jgi:hypothetical protein